MLLGPLTGSRIVLLVERIPVEEIIRAYKKQFNIDTRRFFKDLKFVELYHEEVSGYKFFSPDGIEGDSLFYEELQKFDWYYMKWKWEHENCLRYLKEGNHLLEIGTGQGAFLEKLSSLGFLCKGLELNAQAVDICQKKGLNVYKESIQDHVKNNADTYDCVCSFQVMEHIGNVKEIIDASIKSLKPGGNLVISVPNNDSFLGYSRNYLNLPPHHMGLWDRKSLLFLSEIFPIEIVSCDFEPLQEYHFQYFFETMKAHYYKKKSWLSWLIQRVFIITFPFNLWFFSKNKRAFTIQVVYRKI